MSTNLALAPQNDRRSDTRSPVQLPVEYRIPGKPGCGTAVITDVSDGGVGLRANSELTQGTVLVLKVSVDMPPTKAAWLIVRVAHVRCLDGESEYAAGCVCE